MSFCENIEYDHDEHLRRLAIQLVGQLPPGQRDVEAVMTHMRHTIDRILFPSVSKFQVVVVNGAGYPAANDIKPFPTLSA